MIVNLTPPIDITLHSAQLLTEDRESGIGTIAFQIYDQPCYLIITTSMYTYDISVSIGDRVRLTSDYGSLGTNSEGVLKDIIVDSTQDKAKVYFDSIVPNQTFANETNIVENTDISLEFTVPLELLETV